MHMALFPPLVADFLLILTGVISIVALVAAAYSWSINIGQRKQLDQFAAIEAELEKVKSAAKPKADSKPADETK